MYCDPSGHFAITTFLITLAVGALVTWAAGEIFGHQLVGGIGSMTGGYGAISTGVSLCYFGPWGVAAGLILIGIGAVTMSFGANEVVDHFSGVNIIQSATGWNDSTYNGVYIGLNIASAVGTIAGNVGMRYASNRIFKNIMADPQSVQKYSYRQFEVYAKHSTWKIDYLNKGTHKGQGLGVSSGFDGQRIQWHPGGQYHFDGSAYWKVSSGLLGKQWFPYLF